MPCTLSQFIIHILAKSTNKLIFCLLVLLCFQSAHSQKLATQSAEVLQNLSDSFKNRYQTNRAAAFRLATINKWPLIKKYANGRVITLEGVDLFGNPVYYTTHNIVAANGTHTSELYQGGSLGLNLNGSTPELDGRLGIWDGGQVRPTHIELLGRVKQQDGATTLSDHTTHLAGTMAASGINPQIRGMAYNTKLSVWNYTDDLVEMAQVARTMLVSNHAYGPVAGWFNNPDRPGNSPHLKWEWWGTPSVNELEDYRFGFYDEKARDLDKLTNNSPYYLVIKSADNKRVETGPPAGTSYFLRNSNQQSTVARSKNDGYDVIPTDANAKNILTVGAADIEIGKQNMYTVSAFSGWGPTDDGRIKPDLLGVGRNIISSVATANNAYAVFSGTSTASANVSGSLFLLQELFFLQNKFFMRSATLKGLALHTADKPAGNKSPNYEYGWGLLNTEKAAKVLVNNDKAYALMENTLRQGEVFQQKIIASGNGPLIATICWTDPEGLPTQVAARYVNDRSPKLINDLDIRVTDASKTDIVWYPWVLDPANPSKPATVGDNVRDNVEQVYIPQTTPGKIYIISVRHKRALSNNGQPYSLIITGLQPQDCSAAVRVLGKGDTTLCGGGQANMQVVGGDAFNYEWFKDGQLLTTNESATLSIQQEGLYQVKIKGYQCSAESRTIIVKKSTLTASTTPSGSLTVCTSTPVRLVSNTGTDYKYQWHKEGQKILNADAPFYDAVEAGKYTVSITNQNCTATSQAVQLLSPVIKPVISTNSGTVIAPNGSLKLTTNEGTGMNYRWFLDNQQIMTATSARLTASQAGSYTVEISQNNCSLLSKPLILRQADNSAVLIQKINLKLYPNPTTSYLTVSYASDNAYNLEAAIVDEKGVPYTKQFLNDDGSIFKAIFDVTNLPIGRYLIVISDGVRNVSKPFVKY
jgi:Subtilase family